MMHFVIQDVREIENRIRKVYKGMNPEILARTAFAYRGQNQEYRLIDGLTGVRSVWREMLGYEPSLVPNFYRRHPGERYKFPVGLLRCLESAFYETNPDAYHRLMDENFFEQTIEIAQHYGLSTNGLDVTFDIGIALWFSTNEYLPNERRFVPYRWAHISNPFKWPVVYVIALDKNFRYRQPIEFSELSSFGLAPKRVIAQRCQVYGFGEYDPNAIVNHVPFRFFLEPQVTNLPAFSYEELFPPPERDPMYARLLQWKKATNSFARELSEIIEYKYYEHPR